MKIQYFADTDTLTIVFNDRPVSETADLNENTLVDLDEDGRLVALTLEHAREVVDLTDISFKKINNMDNGQPLYKTVRVEGWNEFLEFTEKLIRAPVWSGAFVFRGQESKDWSLQSSLGRQLEGIPNLEVADIEEIALKYFVARARNYLHHLPESDQNWWEWWPIMQHYGVPTRLLDWTRSIYVAAYFAVRDVESDADAAIYVVPFEEVNLASFRSRNVPLDHEFLQENSHDHSRSRIGFFTPHRMTDRMAAQQGMHSVCNSATLAHDKAIADCLPDDAREYFMRIDIPREQKRWFAHMLQQMNVTAGALFPGIDGLGREVKELIPQQILEDVLGRNDIHSNPLEEDRHGSFLAGLLQRIIGEEEE